MINLHFPTTLLIILLLSLAPYPSFTQQILPVKDPLNPVFSFGSCIDLYGNQNSRIFHYISQQSLDVFTWLGDVVYLPPNAEDEKLIIYLLNFVKHDPLYSKIRQKAPIIGTWDDHDYGQNDGDKLYVHKERNKQLFLDFLDEPKTSPRRSRDGVYESYYLGEQKRVKIILLDVRYNRDPRFSKAQDMLGETQWDWLEKELKDSSADFTLIGSGSQVLPDDRLFTETWYGGSRKRLLEMIRKYKVSGVILLSGDVHFAEVMRYPCPERIGYKNLYEFTSSGLTQYPPVPQAKQLLDEMFPYTYNEPKDRYFTRNFGMIRFSFEGEEPKAVLEIRNEQGKKIMEKEIYASEMRFSEENVNLESECVLDESGYWRFGKKLWGELRRGNFFVVKYPIVNGRHLMRLVGVRMEYAVGLGIVIMIGIGVLVALVLKRGLRRKEKKE